MNAVLKTEAIVIDTAAPLEVADPTKNLILVPLSQLLPRRSRRNVRTTPRQSIPELAASIARVGLLQNLVVILSADGEQYEVVAGDRRLTALKLLAKKKRIAADFEVPCLLVADASARTVSLAENVQREAMHPADQFAAFAALVKEGRPIEDIAADFGVSPLVVQRRLKLANVSPRLLTDYRTGDATLEQLMALTITDDHTAQEAAYYGAPEWQRGASALRERLTEREITATHPLVCFVGLDAYTAAGGGIRRDLFAEGDAGTYLTDAALLESLVRGKLDMLAEDVRAEGWAWVEAVPHVSHAERQSFQNAPRQRREPTAREARRIASLQTRLDEIDSCEAVLVPGQVPRALVLPDMQRFRAVAEWIRHQHGRGVLACGSCGGVYLLGEAGLLNGRRCTTTWWLHDELIRRYPKADAAWGGALTEHERVVTAGGALSWTDISLHVVRLLCGPEAAHVAGDYAVVDTTPSSQAVYIPAGHLAESNPFLLEAERAVRHVRGRRLTTTELAERLSLSERTLHRRLRSLTGESPKRFIDRVRFEMARTMLDAGTMSIKQVALTVGYEDDSSFRRSFRQFSSMTPTAYRARG